MRSGYMFNKRESESEWWICRALTMCVCV